jgi:hypothetical protein
MLIWSRSLLYDFLAVAVSCERDADSFKRYVKYNDRVLCLLHRVAAAALLALLGLAFEFLLSSPIEMLFLSVKTQFSTKIHVAIPVP